MGEGLSVAREFCCSSGRPPAEVSSAACERKFGSLKKKLHYLNEQLGHLVEQEITSLFVCDEGTNAITMDEAKRLLKNLEQYNFVVHVDMAELDRNANGSIEKEEFESALRVSIFHRPENLELLVQSCDEVENQLKDAFTDNITESRTALPRRSMTVPAVRMDSAMDADRRTSSEPAAASKRRFKRGNSAPDVPGSALISVTDFARLIRELLVELGHTDVALELQSDNGTAAGDLMGQLVSFDADGDGQLTFDEFFNAYCKFLVRIYYLRKSSLLKKPGKDKDKEATSLQSAPTVSF